MSHRNTSFALTPNHDVNPSESDSSDDSTFCFFSTSSADDDSDDSDWDEAPATQPPAPRIPDFVIDGHRQEGESDLRGENRCAILACCSHFLILAQKRSVEIEVMMSDNVRSGRPHTSHVPHDKWVPSISMHTGGDVRKVVDHQLGSDEQGVYIREYKMEIGRVFREGAVQKQHINETLKLIADLFNKDRHHAGGAEAICRHITLKMTSPHTVPRMFAWVTDLVDANKWDRVFWTWSQDVFENKFEAQFVYKSD